MSYLDFLDSLFSSLTTCIVFGFRNETKRNDFCSLFYCNCFHNKDINNIAQQNEAKWCWWNLSKVSHCILSSHKMWVFNCSNSLWWCRSLSLSLSLFLSLSLMLSLIYESLLLNRNILSNSFLFVLLFHRYGPHFEDAPGVGQTTNLTVQAGCSVYLNCRISLLQDKTVTDYSNRPYILN